MQSDTVVYKVVVFISSKCGGKYTIIRKALKELLLETGLTNVYAFETAPGCSQPLPDAYLQYINESHLCLFLIDNKDGVTDPVLAEYQRAKELRKKIIFVFCDEEEKKPTPVEEEIRRTQICKYCTVHEFSDITKEAYKSVMQDILDAYKKNSSSPTQNGINNNYSTEKDLTVADSYIIDKNMFKGFGKTRNELVKLIFPFHEEADVTSELDEKLQDFINVIICKKRFDSIDYEKLCEKVVELHQYCYKDLILLRLKAIKFFYEDKIPESIDTLKEALKISTSNSEIANWISNDIAIDLRNMIAITDEIHSNFTMNNEGQEFINNNCETVFFPVLDRFENNMNEKIIKQYFKSFTDSPYTSTLGGQGEVFKDIALCFCAAIIYGSITQLQMTRSRIIDALSALCFEYGNHDLSVELLKMLIIERQDKDLEKFIRIYNQSVDVINSNDVDTIQAGIECIPIQHYRRMSEFLLLKHFGYYFSDLQFEQLSEKLMAFSLEWLENKNRIFNFCNYIFGTLKENSLRLNIDSMTKFIINVLSMDGNRWYDDACTLSCLLDYSLASEENLTSLLEKNLEIVRDEQRRNNLNKFSQHLIHFRLAATINLKVLDVEIQKNMPDFYNSIYHLEIFDKDRESSINNIRHYLDDIGIRNEEQGKNGVYHGYSSNPYATICNIIKHNNLYLNWNEISPIIDGAKNTLLAPKQGYQDKCNAILLLTFLKNHFNYTTEWEVILDSLKNQEEHILSGNSVGFLDKDTERVLYVTYQIMLFIFGRSSTSEIINTIISISNMNDYEILQCLNNIESLLYEFDYSETDDLIVMFIIQLACIMTNHKERDIRFFAIKCLIQLTHSKYSQIILPQLSSIMDTGASIIKAAIISRVKKIENCDEGIINYIIQKGKVDNNYLVRKVAIDLEGEVK